MSSSARLKVALGLPLVLLVLWLVLDAGRWSSAWAHNRGFLALNRASVSDNPAADQRAAVLLEEAIHRNPESSSLWRSLGYARLALGQTEAAIAAWQHFPAMAGELVASGAQAEAAGQIEEAIRWYQHATSVAPEDVAGWLALGQTYETRGDGTAAALVYNAGLEAQTSRAGANSDLYFRLARVRSNMGQPVDYRAVLEATDRAIQIDRYIHEWSRTQSHYLRAVALDELGRDREAMAEFVWVVERLPDDYWSLVHLGRLAWELDGDGATAENRLRAAIDVDGDSKWAYLALADVYWQIDRREEALELYGIVLQIDPDDPAANSRLGEQ